MNYDLYLQKLYQEQAERDRFHEYWSEECNNYLREIGFSNEEIELLDSLISSIIYEYEKPNQHEPLNPVEELKCKGKDYLEMTIETKKQTS